ncbi:MAG: hypothetical protein BTN85_0211 [Candidatus Methanohalarchaeum thermophilum]|uniref:Replication protein A C-terminal domain-containing protein n=1 Tax=Methanohalarchaeum thermophilum TaxID=1903181 RepID=A0A1Q6DTU4_METT1|nr:MAG: hypothetical protein BTN85_0211 [Candidatus Methanohalarchaeum thermophilum]
MGLEEDLLRLLKEQDKENAVSADLISQRLGRPKFEVENKLDELERKGMIYAIEAEEGDYKLYFVE